MTISENSLDTASPRKTGLVLLMLLVVYIFNFVDRQIIAILAAPIQNELDLSDSQMGLLGGLAFALLYCTLGVPLAALADRKSRSWVITLSLGVWSLFTALCAVTQGFWQLFLARIGVGVGEAGGVAPSYALIGDYFPREQRAVALSIYSLGIPAGSALGIFAGGYIAATIDWRIAFLVVGAAGLLTAPLFKWVVRDLPRDRVTAPANQPGFAATWHCLSSKPSFWLMALGAACASMIGYGISFWLPSLLQRSFGLSLIESSQFFGLLILMGGTLGILGGGTLADWLGQKNRAFYALVPAICFTIAVPLFVLGIGTDNAWLAFFLLLVPQTLAYVWFGPLLSAVQNLVPTNQRATASALFLLIVNLLGLGGGVYALGAMSDALTPYYGTEALRYSTIYGLSLYALAAILLFFAARYIARDWVREQAA
ncbi:spinster family MFS transporter [Altericroceibacterium endophyticum]|uniref:MFS transporter n=1 Tax=Altericroceibacterium endophyticum TaxID=1808508 RepID=A0A6I4T6H7_9SPHN|nr:MFS transporter [Altericroceibacterium endophyticum]MXO66814.1 MFS transporter [Altericroceibacterium endophyticum]